jgi:hypothetical protein
MKLNLKLLQFHWRRIACSLAILTTIAGVLESQEVLTNQSVIQMVQAHLGTDIIVRQIRNSPGHYVLTTANLIKLKQSGVPEAVITAMQAKNALDTPSSDAASSLSAKEPLAQGVTANGVWKVKDESDAMTGTITHELVLKEDVESNGRHGIAEVTTTCDPNSLTFDIVYAAAFDKEMGFVQTQPDPTVFMGQVYSHKPRVMLRMRIDNNIRTVASTADYQNEAILKFSRKPKDPAESLITMLDSVGITDDIDGAKLMRVELPLTNGDRPIVEIHPQDPVFQSFISGCKSNDSDQSTAKQPATGPVVSEDEANRQTIRLTRSSPSAQRIATIIAPGAGRSRYSLIYIDARDFAQGGIIRIDISISVSSETTGSFDLFPGDINFTKSGSMLRKLASRNVGVGGTTYLEYRFPVGQILALGIEGGPDTPQGATGRVSLMFNVH